MEERRFEVMTGQEYLENRKYWPITYILKSKDGKKMYIGISRDFEQRWEQHKRDELKEDLEEAWVISHTKANESISYYLESFLIHFGRMNNGIKNINTKVQSGELYKTNSFYNKNIVELESKKLYQELCKMGIFSQTLDELKNHAFTKLNPDLGFTNRQIKIIDESIELISKGKIFHITGSPGTGKTAILVKIVNDYSLLNEDNEERKILGVYSASVQNRKIIKKYIELISNGSDVIFFDTLSKVRDYINKNESDNLHLIVDESQSLSAGKYGSKIHIGTEYNNELEWIRDNINSFTLIYDQDQSDFYEDIDIASEIINRDELILELKEQFRLKADKLIFDFYKEFLEMNKVTNRTFTTYEYKIEIVDSLKEGMDKLKQLDLFNEHSNSKMLSPGHNKEHKIDGIDNVLIKVNNDDRSKDVMDLPIDKFQSSKRLKGVSIENSLVVIGNEIIYRDGRIIVNPELWTSNVIQELTREEQIRKIKSSYYILLTRASEHQVVYIHDKELREHFRKMCNERIVKEERDTSHFTINI